ncbi:MAG: hypothetical protein GY864_02670 [Desulfobacterales bacterium]|nr:hypothetical protein [Desulfobacterales bacterium]
MENKRLGRGLKEISDIFLSTDKKSGSSSKKLREETCESCNNFINDKEDSPQCLIYTIEYHQYGVCHKETVKIEDAHDCDYFKPIISNFLKMKGAPSDLVENMCEVEENVTIEKNISYPNTPDAQQNIIESLCKHLEADFSIKKIELVKTDTECQPGQKKSKEERITIFIEDHPSLIRI